MKNARIINRKKADGTLHKLRYIAGCALIGSIVAGAFFGWVDTPVDLRAVGVGIGAIAGVLSNHILA